MRRPWCWFASHLLAAVLAVSCSRTSPQLPPEPEGINPSPTESWLRCVCSQCQGAGGLPLGDEPVGGCSTAACGDAAAQTATCSAICQHYGLTSCGSTSPATAGGCEPKRCEHCAGSTCSRGVCYGPGEVCGRECSSGTDCGCDECIAQGGTAGVCLPPKAGTLCGGHGTPPVYVDRAFGRVSVALGASSTVAISAPGWTGQGSLAQGSLLFVARNCPGPACALRMNDLWAKPAPFSIFSADAHTPAMHVSDGLVTTVRPLTFAVGAAGAIRVPPRGLEVMIAFTLDGTRFSTNALNQRDVEGGLDLGTGEVWLAGTFTSANVTIAVHLVGQIDNLPPVARAGADQPAVECASPAGTLVQLDGTASTDAPPGPGITRHLWFEDYNRITGRGTLVATGPAPQVRLGLGRHALTLAVVDGAGAMDLDDVAIEVVDTQPAVVTADIANDCLWPPNHKLVRYELGKDIAVTAQNGCAGDLSAGVRILHVESSEPEDDVGDGSTAADFAFDGGALCVRAERSGPGDGRVYRVTLGVQDPSGNLGITVATITVPHDRRVHTTGPQYGHLKGDNSKCGPESPAIFLEDSDPRCHFAAELPAAAPLTPAGGCATVPGSLWTAALLAFFSRARRGARRGGGR